MSPIANVEFPVPPYAGESVEVAETTPLIACRGPESEPIAKVVVVALLVVAFRAVKFWSVVEPRVRKLVEKRLVAVRAVELAYVIVVAPVSEKKDEVASAVGTPEAPVTFARMEFAAMAVRPAVPAE